MKNPERYRHLRVDWVGQSSTQSITLCAEPGQIGVPMARVRGVPFSLSLGRSRIGPRRQGFASPLRALDRSGPI